MNPLDVLAESSSMLFRSEITKPTRFPCLIIPKSSPVHIFSDELPPLYDSPLSSSSAPSSLPMNASRSAFAPFSPSKSHLPSLSLPSNSEFVSNIQHNQQHQNINSNNNINNFNDTSSTNNIQIINQINDTNDTKMTSSHTPKKSKKFVWIQTKIPPIRTPKLSLYNEKFLGSLDLLISQDPINLTASIEDFWLLGFQMAKFLHKEVYNLNRNLHSKQVACRKATKEELMFLQANGRIQSFVRNVTLVHFKASWQYVIRQSQKKPQKKQKKSQENTSEVTNRANSNNIFTNSDSSSSCIALLANLMNK